MQEAEIRRAPQSFWQDVLQDEPDELRARYGTYHAFTKWLDFGGDVIGENELNEQQKRLRYIDLVASAVILQNTVDMMRIMQDVYAAGEAVSAADVEFMSPYGTFGVKRFGNYHLDMKRPPESWLKESQFKQAAKLAKAAAAEKKRNDEAGNTP